MSTLPHRAWLAACALMLLFTTQAISVSAARAQESHEPVIVGGTTYDAYIPAAIKHGPFKHYTCEFDAAWIVLKTFGHDVGLDEQLGLLGVDHRIEPYYEETGDRVIIHGGDVTKWYSGDYTVNFLARTTGAAMRKVFDHFDDVEVDVVKNREQVERALLNGQLIWIKTTVDFKEWVPATWVMPNGETYQTVLGNDHAVVVMGFNADVVVIRDPLGPTSSNWDRQYEYEVDWDTFMWAWGAQGNDGLAVGPKPAAATPPA